MIVLDRDVLFKLTEADEAVVQHLTQYSSEEWTIPALVAWESYKAQQTRTDMQQVQRKLHANLDRIIKCSDDVALEAAYLDEKLRAHGVEIPPVDLLNLATAFAEGGTFVTHNKTDFDKGPVHELANIDIIYTDS